MSHITERFSSKPKGTPNMRRSVMHLSLDIVSTGELRDLKPFKGVKMIWNPLFNLEAITDTEIAKTRGTFTFL